MTRLAMVLMALMLLIPPRPALPLEVPPLAGHVNDIARMLSPQAVEELERTLTEFEAAESSQVVVVTVPTLAGEDLEGYSIRVAERWRIGRQGLDNGVILLVVRDDRRVRLEVGKGLEGRLTDLHSGRIIRNEMSPRLRAGDYDGGIRAGVTAIMAAVRGEYHPADSRDLQQGRKSAPPAATLLLVLALSCIFLGAISRILGGVAGAVGLPATASLLIPGLGGAWLALLAGAGFLFGLFLTVLFGRGGRGGFFGGPFIGGGGFGGSSGGGGFSGGGGEFGGGGASGEW